MNNLMNKKYYLYYDLALDLDDLAKDDIVRRYIEKTTVFTTQEGLSTMRWGLYHAYLPSIDRELELNNIDTQEMYIDNAVAVHKDDKIYNMIKSKICPKICEEC